MTIAYETDGQELEFRRRWHQAHVERFSLDEDANFSWRERYIQPHADEGREFLAALGRSRDLAAFQGGTDRWVRSFGSGYAGTAGQMIINQISKMAQEPEVAAEVLYDSLSTPVDLADAVRKIRTLADFLATIRVGAHPSPTRAPFVASYYWALDQPDRWPAAWPKSMLYLEFCTGEPEYEDQGARYGALYRFAMEIDGDPQRFERVASWWDEQRPVIVDEVLCDRAAYRVSGNESENDLANARALVAVAKHIGVALEDAVARSAGRTLRAHKPSVMWADQSPRADLWVDWRVPGTYGLAVRIWLNAHGVAVGLRPTVNVSPGGAAETLGVVEQYPIEGYELLAGGRTRAGRDVGFIGGVSGEVMYGRWFDRSSFPTLDLSAEVLTSARDVAPLIAKLNGDHAHESDDDELAEVVAEFVAATGYPTESHEEDKAYRREFAELLAPNELAIADPADLRRIWGSGLYGRTGPMSVLNTSIRDADEAEYQRIVEALAYVCWGDDPVAARIDAVLTDDDLRVRGLGESVMMKMLAITHPEQFITVYPYMGPMGKLRMLKLLGLDAPEASSRGELQVQANDLLRSRLDRYFPGDPLGIGSFLYWYAEHGYQATVDSEVDPFDELADELLVEREFLDDIVALLADKRQVVFYGPPGTGKTYFARKLAEALVPDAVRRAIVQFHPSTSYEDFFEGYRPETDVDGVMTYRLQKGPLAELAARASASPGRRHLMIIDEINRANLPKVLGELLFLFEYRDTPIRTLYRPDAPFELPKDVWFIGTMNTADRSIALVDAALRRRFHFVPFFPNHGPMSGMLDRWLAREGEPAWVGELVAQVNDELEKELGGPHLQLGASHFMKSDLDRERLRRIWEYDIEPFIEDQFFGDPERITRFRFDQVWQRFSDLASESIREGSSESEGDIGAP